MSPLLEKCLCQSRRRGNTPGGRSRAHSLAPHRPSPVASARACLAASVFSEPPCLRLDSFAEVKRAGSSPRLAVHRGSSHNSRPPGRAAPHRWPTLRLPVSNPTAAGLSFLFLFPSFFVLVANLGFLSSLFPSFFFFSFAAGGVEKRGSSLESFLKCPGAAATVLRGGNSSAPAAAVAARAAVRCGLSLDKRPSLPGFPAQSAASARLSPAPAARSLLLAVG